MACRMQEVQYRASNMVLPRGPKLESLLLLDACFFIFTNG